MGHRLPSRRQFLKRTIGLPVLATIPTGISNITPEPRRSTEQTNTPRIQKAIDQVAQSGGGIVYLPVGRYISGTLQLRSRVTLWLGNGATLVMSKDPTEFLSPEKLAYDPKANFATSTFHVALIVGHGLEHVSIIGDGEIDCESTKSGGPKPIALRRCSNVLVRDITIRNAAGYNISLLGCEFVTLDNLTIRNGLSDGIDPDCCRHVRISNCFVESYGDAIVLKTSGALGEHRATEYVTVDNCILRTASVYFKCGTESQRRCNYIALHPQRRQLPIQHVSRRASFITGSQLLDLSQLPHQPANRFFPVGDHSQRTNFSARFGYRHRDRICVDIQTNKSYFAHRPTPFACGSAQLVTATGSVTRAYANQKPVFSFTPELSTSLTSSHND